MPHFFQCLGPNFALNFARARAWRGGSASGWSEREGSGSERGASATERGRTKRSGGIDGRPERNEGRRLCYCISFIGLTTESEQGWSYVDSGGCYIKKKTQ